MALLPAPPSGVPLFNPQTNAIDIQWQNYFNALATITGGFAPVDARYWVSTPNSDLTNETNIGALLTGYLKIVTAAGIATPSTTTSIPGTDITGSALTKTDDTNVTLTLGGSPTTALLRAASLTLGWTGTLARARGGTGLSVAGSSGNVLTSNGTDWVSSPSTTLGAMTLLHAGQGTDTNAGAMTVDSVALSGLTNLDTLMVFTNLETATANTAQVFLYSVTDTTTITPVTPSPLVAAVGQYATTTLTQRQGTSTSIASSAYIQHMDASGSANQGQYTGLATAWTASWTLGLRHGGVTAGGTFKYMWSVYKQAGQ